MPISLLIESDIDLGDISEIFNLVTKHQNVAHDLFFVARIEHRMHGGA